MSGAATSSSDMSDPAAALAQLKYAVDNIVTPVVIAAFLACALYGGLLYLAASYFSRFATNDRLAFKILVGFLTLSALADTMSDCAWSYLYTVKAIADPTILSSFPWTFTVYAILTGPNVLLAQAFFTWRVWVVSNRKNWWLPSIMLLLELTACALSWYLAYWSTKAQNLAEFADVKGIMYAWLASGFICDTLITSAIVYYLLIRPRRVVGASTAVKLNSSSPLARIVIKTFQTNAASLLIQTFVLVIIITKGSSVWYTIPGFQESKIYIISVIATLNARNSSSAEDSDFTSSTGGTSPLKFSAKAHASTFSLQGQRSVPVHVHVSREVDVDEAMSKELALGPAAPYAVRFERAEEGMGGEVELGRKEGYARAAF